MIKSALPLVIPATFLIFSGTGFWKAGDQTLIDGLVVNGSAKAVGALAAVTRKLQTGFIYSYATAMVIGVLVLLTVFVVGV